MTRPFTLAAVLFAAAAVLVAGSPHAATQPYHAAVPAAVQVPYYGAVYGQPGALIGGLTPGKRNSGLRNQIRGWRRTTDQSRRCSVIRFTGDGCA